MSLIIDGNAVYEIDDECQEKKLRMQEKEESKKSKSNKD